MSDRPRNSLSALLHNLRRDGKRRRQRDGRGRTLVLEGLETRSLLSTIFVNSTADTNPAVRSAAGVLTLREAILLADLDPSLPYASLTPKEKAQLSAPPSATAPNTIVFTIGLGDQFIFVGSTGLGALPAITRPTILDATPPRLANGAVLPQFATQVIDLRGSRLLGGNGDGLTVIGGSRTAGGGSVIRGFDISGFVNGIALLGNPNDFRQGYNTVEGNFIGVDSGGRVGPRLPQNTGDGVFVEDSPNDTIGAATNLPPALAAGRGNVLANNQGDGVEVKANASTVAAQCTIIGNFIGTTSSGTTAAGNQSDGVRVQDATNVLVKNNTISGNQLIGVDLVRGLSNTVEANFIGTDRFGAKALANTSDGVFITGGSAIVKRNLVSGNKRNGVEVSGTAENVVIENNSIGTDRTGSLGLGNTLDGVHIGIQAVGTSVTKNLISANDGAGVDITDEATTTLVTGNFIGTDRTGSKITGTDGGRLGNAGPGVWIDGTPKNTIGGTLPGEKNVISGNLLSGVKVSGEKATENQISGNYIGTDKSGQIALGNKPVGILIDNFASDTFVGGIGNIHGGLPELTDGANLISGNGSFGVLINGAGTTKNFIGANFIGTKANGTEALGNGPADPNGNGGGVVILNAPNNMLSRNLISGNNQFGVVISGATASGNLLGGNLIGTDKTGAEKVPNATDGVRVIDAPGNFIGSATNPLVNVISGNKGDGVAIQGTGSTGNQVQFNDIGTDVTGTIALGNGGNGVTILNGSSNLIGGSNVANSARNVISGNFGAGVSITGGERATQNQVVNNLIGTATDGSTSVPNQGAGVSFAVGSDFNQVVTNVIAFNSGAGVRDLNPAPSNLISRNSIFLNAKMGIDLGPVGPTLNGVPVFTSAVAGANTTTVTGTLASAPNTTYTLEFFSNTERDPSGHGQGRTYLGSLNVTTDGNGNANWTTNLAVAVPVGQFISATATDPVGRTTEFSTDATVAMQVNLLPLANDDQYVTAENTVLTVAAGAGVLANDSDADGDALKAVLASNPANGQLTLNPDGSFTYDPNADFNGIDTFTYFANDGLGNSNLATVTITVTAVNQPPIALPQSVSTIEDTQLSIPAANLLVGDTPGPPNESGQSLTVIGVGDAVNGTVALSGGTVTFTPAAQFTGTATFTYTIEDNGTTDGQPDPKTATATVNVTVAPPVNVSTSTTVAGTPNPSVFGQPVTFTATVTPASPDLGPPTGTVQFQVDGTNFGTPVPLSAGVATSASLATLTAGPHTITALYSGDAQHIASMGTFTQTVNPAATSTTVTSNLPTSVFGQLVTFTATVTPTSPGGGPPTGMVEFQSISPDGTIVVTLGTAPLDSTGTAVFSMNQLVPASHTIFAVYLGDGNNAGNTSSQITQLVQPADTTISISSANAVTVSGQPNTFTLSLAVVPPGAPIVPATGTITVYDTFEGTTTALVTLTIGQSGQSPALTAVGTHVITAVYSGDSNYNGSTSEPINQEVIASG
jgi:parallel beta-helix repeat protein/VCBS repeat-containing protein